MAAANRLPVRTTVTIRNSSDGSVEGTERYLRGLPFRFGEGDDWVKVGPLKIGEMRPGEWRLLTSREVATLKAAVPAESRKA